MGYDKASNKNYGVKNEYDIYDLADWSFLSTNGINEYQPIAEYKNVSKSTQVIHSFTIKKIWAADDGDYFSNGWVSVTANGNRPTIKLVCSNTVYSDETYPEINENNLHSTIKAISAERTLPKEDDAGSVKFQFTTLRKSETSKDYFDCGRIINSSGVIDFSQSGRIVVNPGETVYFGFFIDNGEGSDGKVIQNLRSTFTNSNDGSYRCATANLPISRTSPDRGYSVQVETLSMIEDISIDKHLKTVTVNVSKPKMGGEVNGTLSMTFDGETYNLTHSEAPRLYQIFGSKYKTETSINDTSINEDYITKNSFTGTIEGYVEGGVVSRNSNNYVASNSTLKGKLKDLGDSYQYTISIPSEYSDSGGLVLKAMKGSNSNDTLIDMENLKVFGVRISCYNIRKYKYRGTETNNIALYSNTKRKSYNLYKLSFKHPTETVIKFLYPNAEKDANGNVPMSPNYFNDKKVYKDHVEMKRDKYGYGYVYARNNTTLFSRMGADIPENFNTSDSQFTFNGWKVCYDTIDKDFNAVYYSDGKYIKEVDIKYDTNDEDKNTEPIKPWDNMGRYQLERRLTLYPNWIEEDLPNPTITFKIDDASNYSSDEDSIIKRVGTNELYAYTDGMDEYSDIYKSCFDMSKDIPTKEDNQFTGWYLKDERIYSAGGKPVKGNSCWDVDDKAYNNEVTAWEDYYKKTTPITLKAKWRPSEYIIRYNSGISDEDAEINSPIRMTKGNMSNITTPVSVKDVSLELQPCKYIWAGHTFTGWKYSDDSSKKDNSDTQDDDDIIQKGISGRDFIAGAKSIEIKDKCDADGIHTGERVYYIDVYASWKRDPIAYLKADIPSPGEYHASINGQKWYAADLFVRDKDGSWKAVFKNEKVY